MEADARAELLADFPLLAMRARKASLSGYGQFFWKPNAGAMKLTGISMASHRASMIAVVSGVVRPGSSSMESSRRKRRPARW